jgi:hypothetical protein
MLMLVRAPPSLGQGWGSSGRTKSKTSRLGNLRSTSRELKQLRRRWLGLVTVIRWRHGNDGMLIKGVLVDGVAVEVGRLLYRRSTLHLLIARGRSACLQPGNMLQGLAADWEPQLAQ